MEETIEIVITTCPTLTCKKEVAGRRNAGIAVFLCPHCQTLFYSSGGKKVVLKKGEGWK